jgi:hypothetical protein
MEGLINLQCELISFRQISMLLHSLETSVSEQDKRLALLYGKSIQIMIVLQTIHSRRVLGQDG